MLGNLKTESTPNGRLEELDPVRNLQPFPVGMDMLQVFVGVAILETCPAAGARMKMTPRSWLIFTFLCKFGC